MFQIMKFLIPIGHANVGARDEDGRTLLHIACEQCQGNTTIIIQYLIHECHANVEARDNHGRAPLRMVELCR